MPVPVLSAQSPSFGRISWPAFSIQYGGTTYSVGAYNTEKKFTWWKYNGGSPTLNFGDQLPDGRLKNNSLANALFANPSPNDPSIAAHWGKRGWNAIGGADVPKHATRVLSPLPGEAWSQSKWTRNFTGGVAEPIPGTFRTNGTGAGGWDASFYSSEGYRKNAYVSFTAEGATGDSVYYMVGLNSDPASTAYYDALDYAWYSEGTNGWAIFESGTNASGTYFARAAGDVCLITYDGANIRYYLNGSLKRTVARPSGAPLYLDSSFISGTNSSIGLKNLQFGPMEERTAAEYAIELKTGTGTAAAADSCGIGTDEFYSVTPGDVLYYQIEISSPVDTGGLYVRYNDQAGTEHYDLGVESWTVGPTSRPGDLIKGSWTIPAGVTSIQPFVLLYAPASGANATMYLKAFQLSSTPIQDALTGDDLLLFINKNGVPGSVQQTGVVDGSLLVSESVFADAIASNQITGTHILAGEIDSTHIRSGSIQTIHLEAGAITADKLDVNVLSSGFVLTGSLQVGSGYWNPLQGLVIPGVINLSPGNASITAAITATSLTVQKDLSILGTTNILKGILNVANGITPPTAPPGVSQGWTLQGIDPQGYGPVSYGITNHLSDGTILLRGDAFFGGGISAVTKSNGQPTFSPAGTKSWMSGYQLFGGITTVGGYYWALGADSNRSNYWYVYKLDSSFNKVAEYGLVFQQSDGSLSFTWDNRGRPVIGNDGTNIYVAYTNGATGIHMHSLNVSSGQWGSIVAGYTLASVGFANLSFMGIGNYDFGAQRLLFTLEGYGTYVFDTAGTRYSANDFYLAGGANSRGLWWDGARFWAYGTDGGLRQHGTNIAVQPVTASYTWYDGDTSSGSVTHETTASPAAVFSRNQRTILTVETPLAPDSGITDVSTAAARDKANRVGIYVGVNGGARRLQGYNGIDGSSNTIRTLTMDAVNTGSATEPVSNGFSTAANSPGLLQSAGATSALGWQLYGDGSGHMGQASWTAAGAPANGALNPIGALQMWPTNTPPVGWLIANGQAVSRTTYAALYAAMGGASSPFGQGDGSTTFNLPDLAGRAPIGVGTPAGAAGATAHTLGQKSGEETHVLTAAEGPANNVTYGGVTYYFNTAGGQGDRATVSGGAAHNNMQPYLGINFIIRAL
jgi:microcystin-dependent protein